MLGFTKFKINRLVNRRELYSNFSYNKWNQLDTGSKWKCLQQLENHFAAEQGRPAVKVLPISSKEARGAYGGYDPDKNVIYINRDLVEYGTLVGPVDINHPTQLDANMQLFDTIAHEGYHAYQGYAIKHPGFHKDMKQVKEWAINDRNVKYFRRGDEYLVQPRERDAWKYGSEKTREAFDEIEKYYGTEPGRAMYEKSVEDNSYENALERLWNNNPDALNQMYKEMMDAYEERYRENNSTVNLDPITVDEYDAISREAVNRYYEHLKNNPSLSNEDVMRMTGDMSEKYFSAVEEYKNAVQQKEKEHTYLLESERMDSDDRTLFKELKSGSAGKIQIGQSLHTMSTALKDNTTLRFAVITGCLKIAKESIFTGTNNFVPDNITDSRFNEYFGFTQEEVDQILTDANVSGKAEEVKRWYDGYHFGRFDVYCPWDVMNYMRDLQQNPEAAPASRKRNKNKKMQVTVSYITVTCIFLFIA